MRSLLRTARVRVAAGAFVALLAVAVTGVSGFPVAAGDIGWPPPPGGAVAAGDIGWPPPPESPAHGTGRTAPDPAPTLRNDIGWPSPGA
ncbi:hypothetical protein [Streptomyces sp. NPDC051567]|uniref:hypothetical protein n=1 Tax=Streptomyces sp. NPDC051567 TaxID=3365660 RepID=UPI0037B54923